MNFSNNAYSVLDGAIGAADTVVQLAAGAGSRFPASDFLVTLIGYDEAGNEAAWEILLCSSRTGDTLTVTRGQEGTTAAAWANGSRIENRVTAGSMAAVQTQIETIEAAKVDKATLGADSAGAIHNAAAKPTPADADEIGYVDSASSFSLVKITWASLKAWLSSLFVSKSGATMTGPLSVPAGASGAQVPQAQEIPSLVRAMAVGTVSQAGGMPTGAVIEWGSNANGLYVRFADGTQICAQSGTFAGATEMVWTYPAVFASDPNYLSASVNYPSAPRYYTADAATTGGNISATIYRSVREDRAPVADGFPMCVIAIGRWF